MNYSQIKFYESLTEQEQFVIKALALNAKNIDINDLQYLYGSRLLKKDPETNLYFDR
ncbi:MAG: hypothetical protein LBV69_02625 [Bacteroidales bacterium]|jgi:hypothetical protein|nr:hypothetical protein [Bacteroidales bacterium]